jgi:hypothetical protein
VGVLSDMNRSSRYSAKAGSWAVEGDEVEAG